ncbi:MAG: alpha/beta fold hydrolase [Acidobacteriota bacterium]
MGATKPRARSLRSSRRLALVLSLGVLAAALAWLWTPNLSIETLHARYADADSRFVEVGRESIHVRVEGPTDAPVLVLLHGTAASLHTWDGWVDALGGRFRIVRYDLPGFGLTGPRADGDYSIERQVEVGAALLETLEISRAYVAGNSLGGHVAWRWALAHPQTVDALVLISPGGAPPANAPEPPTDHDAGFRIVDLAGMPVVGPLLTRLTPRSLVVSALEQVYGDPSRLEPVVAARYHDLLRHPGNREALVAMMTAEPPRDRPPLTRLDTPTLILWGAEDAWIPVDRAPRFTARMPNAKLVVYDGVGHVAMEEIPRRSADDAARFFAALCAPSQD